MEPARTARGVARALGGFGEPAPVAGRTGQPERFRQLEEVRERNARKIEERPEIVLDNLTRRQSTFTRRDIAREVFRYVDDGERFWNLMTRLKGSPELIVLVPEG